MFPNKISVFESSDGLCIAKTGEEKEDDFRYIKVIIHDRVEATNQSQLKEIQELAAEVAEVTETARMLTVHVDDYKKIAAKQGQSLDEATDLVRQMREAVEKSTGQLEEANAQKRILEGTLKLCSDTNDGLMTTIEDLKDPWRDIKDGPATFPCVIRNAGDYKIVYSLTIGKDGEQDRWEGAEELDYELTHFWPQWKLL